jgi:hypothetical protein
MHINAILCALMPSAQNGRLPVKLTPHPKLAEKRLVRVMQHMQFRAKSAKFYLKPTAWPTDFLKRNFYFETEGV